MTGRRILYIVLLLGAIALYIFYGQYVSLCILLFVSALPLISVLLSLPAILKSHAELKGGTDVQRGRPSKVRLCVDCGFFLPRWKYWRIDKKASGSMMISSASGSPPEIS